MVMCIETASGLHPTAWREEGPDPRPLPDVRSRPPPSARAALLHASASASKGTYAPHHRAASLIVITGEPGSMCIASSLGS